jgi:prepilin-type N-terminal cleavage/methylation domain-containing protein
MKQTHDHFRANNLHARGKQNGFSLIEVIVAIGILGIVVVGISVIPALTLGRSSDTKTYAVNLAREVIDSYRASWLDQVTYVAGTAPTLPSTGLRFSCTIAAPTVTGHAIKASDSSLIDSTATPPKIRRVIVTVSCPNTGDVSLSTYIGDPLFAGS